MRKIVGWFIAIIFILMLAYALLVSDLPGDVVGPFRPPNP